MKTPKPSIKAFADRIMEAATSSPVSGYYVPMEEKVPESFWEALVEVKDKYIKDARELFQTAMELSKKYKDERDECQVEQDRALKAWTEAVSERTNALLERDEYKIGHDRYEKLRRLNLQQIKELYLKNLRTGEHFDILVDKL